MNKHLEHIIRQREGVDLLNGFDEAVIGHCGRSGYAAYSLTKILCNLIAFQKMTWEEAFDYCEYNLMKCDGVIIVNDIDL